MAEKERWKKLKQTVINVMCPYKGEKGETQRYKEVEESDLYENER